MQRTFKRVLFTSKLKFQSEKKGSVLELVHWYVLVSIFIYNYVTVEMRPEVPGSFCVIQKAKIEMTELL